MQSRFSVLLVAALLLLGGSKAMDVPASTSAVPDVWDTGTPSAVAERAAALLAERYVSPALGARYAQALRMHIARGDYAGIAEASGLAARLTADLQAVNADGHLRIYPVEPATPTPGPDAPVLVGEPGRYPGIREMKWIEPRVAYLSFEHFDDRPVAMAAVTAFFRRYASARALVIDSRSNHGGAFDMLGLLCNHLFAHERHLADMDMASAVVEQYGSPFPVDGQVMRKAAGPPGMTRFEHWSVPVSADVWFTVPVYYLTSRDTYSAAEHLAMVLKSTGRAVLVGEATGGGNHFGGTEPVGGGLELFVPVGHTTDPVSGEDWEQKGIAPDVPVTADQALTRTLKLIRRARDGISRR